MESHLIRQSCLPPWRLAYREAGGFTLLAGAFTRQVKLFDCVQLEPVVRFAQLFPFSFRGTLKKCSPAANSATTRSSLLLVAGARAKCGKPRTRNSDAK